MEKDKDIFMKEERRIYTVSELTANIRELVEGAFPEVWVEGEISNFIKHSSGHMYFSLKDAGAVLTCAFFRSANQGLKFQIKEGMNVVCFGKISVYDKRGQYQLYVDKIEPKGVGALQMAFEQLKAKLQKEGLFDEARKRPIPYLPTRIGVVTSPTGAAIRDILNVVKRRFQNVEVILNPVRVQGIGAEKEIAEAIEEFNTFNNMSADKRVDVLIVGRGGGSLEDLWSFNEEIVARAIFDSKIPIISAVGHEIDWTIADFVADKRAPTPSAAAEMVIPRKEDLLIRLEELDGRLDNSIIDKITLLGDELKALSESYILKQPINIIEQHQQRIDDIARNIEVMTGHMLDINEAAFGAICGKLDMLSPFKVLSRGYSITSRAYSGIVVKDSTELKKGDEVKTKLAKGEFISEVK
ncbi:MAG: exodeoxyribonuclease VII large subunit [Candidatus Omnitrophica bacterium]|nr:exodeoxyribonuclease VII large subunit [Candidatus Omnitrophota bacterium]MBU4488282.1 exodeoxyribonuclease VII large subunit [Candidatus Omnitrophota bacterium]MCG2704501.1 exodeoxyribonuclease VII large subunit [Candidatus Omnitrophota bacterium]